MLMTVQISTVQEYLCAPAEREVTFELRIGYEHAA
jgi:hypothetical protein